IIDGKGKSWREAQSRGKTSDVIEEARAGGHDGVIIRNVRDDYTGYGKGSNKATTDTYVVFSSNQIKSADKNSGAFDATNPSILKSASAPKPKTARLTDDQVKSAKSDTESRVASHWGRSA